MANYKELEFEWANIMTEIKQANAIGNGPYVLSLIERAKPIAKELVEHATSSEKKEQVKRAVDTMRALKAKYSGETVELSANGGTVKPQQPKPQQAKPQQGKPAANGKQEQEEGENQDIQYEFDIAGEKINVQSFFSSDATEEVTFQDVQGMEFEKALVEREFFLTEEEQEFAKRIGKKPKKFILLYGVPGTGKTFFAMAVANELKNRQGGDVPFFNVTGGQMKASKVGASEHNMQAIFAFCKQFKKCVLFIDEMDALLPDRKKENGDPTAAGTVTTFLQMVDGFASDANTLVIGAANCPYNMDGAVLSRVNVRIEIPLPSKEVIYGMLDAKLNGRFNILSPDVDLNSLAQRMADLRYSSRDIKNMINYYHDCLTDLYRTTHSSTCLINQEIVDKGFKKIVPTTKQSDLDRIKEFKEKGE